MENTLNSTSDLQTCCCNDSILTINDDGVNVNIMPFVSGCKITPNRVCLPIPYIELEVRKYGTVVTPWKKYAEPFADIDERILTEESYFTCAANNGRTKVSIAKAGQDDVRVGEDNKICDKSELYHFLEAAENVVGPLTDEQLANVELIIDAFIEFGDQDSAKLAYILSTGFGESGYLPVWEGDHVSGWSGQTDMERGAALLNDYINNPELRPQDFHYPHPNTGQYYFGRGFIQLTHYDGYELYSTELTAYYGQNIDLTNNPDLVMIPEYAAIIMVHGMMEGSFGDGLGLNHHINTNQQNFRTARNTVGGVHKQHYIDDAVNLLSEFESIIDALPPEEEPVDEFADIDPSDRHLHNLRPKGKLIAVDGAEITCPNARSHIPKNIS